MYMATTYTPQAQVTRPNGRKTYVPVYLPVRKHVNGKYFAVTAPTLGRNRHFRGGRHV